MIKENQRLLNRVNVVTDAVAALAAVAAAYLIVFILLDFDRNYPFTDYLRLALIFIPVQLITYACMGLYGSFRSKNFATELGRLFGAFLLDGLALVALLYVVRIINFSRWALAVFLVMDLLIVTIKRFVLRKTLRKVRESGYNRKYVLIVGSGDAAQEYLRTIREQRWLGFECAGCVADSPLPGAELLGGMDSLLKVLEERSYDEVVCALGSDESRQLAAAVEACELTGTKISVIPSIYKYMSSSPAIDVVGNIPMMNIRRIPLDNIGNAALKRALDIFGSLVLLVLTSPVMLVSMLIIKLTMGGKVIFKQQRVGLNKKIFTMYKLRSMRDSAEKDTAWSTENDPRRTKFGAFIRKFSIDELPQLVNVLKGDMSLVGPRPEIPFYVNDFKDKIPMYMIKHQVKPGMTGLAQINGYRGDTSIEKRIEFDVQYIENWNFFMDISILLRTAFSGFMNKEKLSHRKRKSKPYRPEKQNMNNKAKTDLMALAMFLPSIIALAFVPVILRITNITTTFRETYMYNGGTEATSDGSTVYNLIDTYSQGKALAVLVLAIIMIFMALICCLSLFRRIEKRSLVYVGASVVYIIMTLASAITSEYSQIAFSGEYDRAEGFWTTACYFVMFLFSMYAFRTSGNFRYLMYGLFFCVGVNFVIGVTQVTEPHRRQHTARQPLHRRILHRRKARQRRALPQQLHGQLHRTCGAAADSYVHVRREQAPARALHRFRRHGGVPAGWLRGTKRRCRGRCGFRCRNHRVRTPDSEALEALPYPRGFRGGGGRWRELRAEEPAVQPSALPRERRGGTFPALLRRGQRPLLQAAPARDIHALRRKAGAHRADGYADRGIRQRPPGLHLHEFRRRRCRADLRLLLQR